MRNHQKEMRNHNQAKRKIKKIPIILILEKNRIKGEKITKDKQEPYTSKIYNLRGYNYRDHIFTKQCSLKINKDCHRTE